MFKHPQCKTFVKYLGEFIDNNLSWKNHVDYIVLKMSKTVVIVSRLQHFLPTNILLSISIAPQSNSSSLMASQDGAKPLNQILEQF